MKGSRDAKIRKSRKSRKSLRTSGAVSEMEAARARARQLLDGVDPIAATDTLYAETGFRLTEVIPEEEMLGYISFYAGDADYEQAAMLENLAFTEAGAGGP
jgi:hypothetical protein